jgi:hypothetical protein
VWTLFHTPHDHRTQVTYRPIGTDRTDAVSVAFRVTPRHNQLYKQAVQILTATASHDNKMSVTEFNGKVSDTATNITVFGKYFIIMRLYLLAPIAYSLVTNKETKRPSH